MAKKKADKTSANVAEVSLLELSIYILAHRENFSRLRTQSVVFTTGRKRHDQVNADRHDYKVIDDLVSWEKEFARILKRSKRLRLLTEKIKSSVT